MEAKDDLRRALIADLEAEYASLDAALAQLNESQWAQATPFRDWTVFDTVAHLCVSERLGLEALTEPEAFAQRAAARRAARAEAREPWAPAGLGADSGAALRAIWRAEAASAAATLARLPVETRIPWYGPPMSVMSFATARLMETWAHGETIHDALGLRRAATRRLRHVCEIGWRTRSFALASHGLPPDDTPVYVELRGPAGEIWSWGDAQAAQRISGSARDFARVVCQCRNVLDTRLAVEGRAAAQWMAVAQCFAGRPVKPPPPGLRRTAAEDEEEA